jgi:hypothetical protein
MMNFALIVLCLAAAADDSEVRLRAESLESLFVEPERAALLRWHADRDLAADSLDYTLWDFQGRVIGAGTAERAGTRTIAVSLTLAQGYYEIEFAGLAARCGLVALPLPRGTPDRFFCIDSALSWLVRDAALRAGLVRVLRRSGIAMSRERLNWGEIEPVRGRFDWQARNGYDAVRQLHADQQLPVLEMFHSATPWSGTLGKYPEDLAGTAASWGEIARQWRGTWGGLEIWNEPDIFFGDHLPADQYAALVKTLAYTVDRAAPGTPLVGGVLAHHHRPFLDTLAACGMLDCVDVASFHTYDRAPQMQALVGKYRDWLAAACRPEMPLWITESGRPWHKGPSRPPADQDIASALDITRKAIEVRACGVARYFAFVFPFYEENNNNFGMMDRWGTPLRSFAAYVQAARVLGEKPYLGDLRLNDSFPPVRVFGDADQAVAVLPHAVRVMREPGRRGSERLDHSAPADFADGLPVLRAEALDGRRLEITDASELPVPDGLAYAWIDLAAIAGRLDTQTEAMRLWRLGQSAAPPRAASSPIVLRWQYEPSVLRPETAGYHLVHEPPGATRLVVRAFNLGSEPAELGLALQLGELAERIRGENRRVLQVPAAGFADAAWEADLTDAFAADDRLEVRVRPLGPAPPGTLPLAATLLGSATFDQRLARHAQRVPLQLGQSARWQPNVPSYGHLELSPQPDDSVLLQVRFGEGDRWVYPHFQLPDDLELDRFTGLVLRARCAHPATVRVFLWEGDSQVGYLTSHSLVPADGQWHAAEVRFDELTLSGANAPDPNGRLDLEQVRRISFGMNSQVAENRLEISAAYLVGPQ